MIIAASKGPGKQENPRSLAGFVVGLLQQHSKHVGVGESPLDLVFRSQRSKRSKTRQNKPIQRARQLREEEVDALEERFRELGHLTNAACEFGITRMTAAKLLGERGIDTSRRRMSASDMKLATDAYLAGDSAAGIGKRLGFAPHTVIKTLRAAGVLIRPRPGRA
ncbi:hypothetical protein ACCO44_11285 [Microbacterium maritypicum]|uniref:hypothetical protein n=1 Tax=Microbacterium maritypicum TaxID=33918 RepID=UPI003557E63C